LTEAGGSKTPPKWVLEGDALTHHAQQLSGSMAKVSASFAAYNQEEHTLPMVMTTTITEDALAKTHRKAVVDLLNSDNNANVIGIEPDRTEKEASFSDPASETSSDDNQSEPKETRRLISSIADMQPFEAMRGAYNPDTNEKYIGDALLQKTYTVSVLDKKRVPNNGLVPKYYVEGSHEAIIDKDTFLRVQAELARRSSIKIGEKKRTYSSKYALSSRVFCGHCGDIYRRIAWRTIRTLSRRLAMRSLTSGKNARIF